MAWTAPRTWVAGEVLTAALMNQQVRDNELILGTHSHGASSSGDGNTTLGPGLKGIILTHQGTTQPAAGASNVRVYGSTDTTAPLIIQVGTEATARRIVDATGAQTLLNKTLTTPVIGDLTNATHSHLNAAGGGTISLPVLLKKTTAQSVSNTTAPQDDNAFVFALASGAAAQISLRLRFDGGVSFPNMDMRYSFGAASGAKVWSQYTQVQNWAGAGAAFYGGSCTTGETVVALSGTNDILSIEAMVKHAASAGNVQFRWMQNAAQGTSLVVTTDSYMTYIVG